MPIRTIVYDDNTDLRDALSDLIEQTDGYELCGAFDNCMSVVEKSAALLLDVVLMDINIPGMSGIEGVSSLKKVFPSIEALLLTIFEDYE